jgi:hypothetical protein
VLVTGLFGACGPIISTSSLHDASEAVERARDLNADELAIYEFTSAEAYLEKAREEWGYSDFQHAIDYARLALEFADRARYRASQGPGTPPTTGAVNP